jgi:hypothetical protein
MASPITVGELTDVPAAGSNVAANFHQEVANRVVQRFANFAALNAWAAGDGSQGYTVDTRRVWLRVAGAWRPFAGSMPRFRLNMTNGLTLAPTTGTPVPWMAESFDTDDVHSVAANQSRITIPAALAGVWAMGYSLDFQSVSGGSRDAWITQNGVIATNAYFGYQSVPVASGAVILQGSTLVVAAANDYFAVIAYQSSSGSPNVALSGAAEFWGHYIGPT